MQSRQLLAASGDPVYELARNTHEPPLLHIPSTTSVGSQTSLVAANTVFPDGNIIVSADYTGQIKVFRQDCAWAFRKPEMSDTASIRLRARSTLARASSSSVRPSGWLMKRNSLTNTSRAASTHSRNSVEGNSVHTNASQQNLALPNASPTIKPNGRQASPSPTRRGLGLFDRGRTASRQQQDPTRLTTPSPASLNRKKSTAKDRLMLQEDGQSLAYYNLDAHRVVSNYTDRSTSVSPIRRRGSLSSGPSDSDEGSSFVDAPEHLSTDDMICKNCGARTFHAFKVQNGPHKGETKLRCSVYVL